MNAKSSPSLRYIAYALCLVVCPAKIITFILGSSAAVSTITAIDYRLPLIVAGWTCIGLATFMMMRANRELTAPAVRRARKSAD